MSTPTNELAPTTFGSIGWLNPVQIANAAVDSFNVYNGDINNVLYVAKDWNPAIANSIPVQPLTNATITGRGTWYAASAPNLPCANVTVSSSATIQPSPAQVATQIGALGLATLARQITQETNIPANMKVGGQGVTQEIAALIATGSAGGAPGGAFPTVFGNNLVVEPINQNMPINAPFALGPYAINQPGYDGYFAITSSAAGGAAAISLLVTWTDASSGVVLNQDFYYFWQGLNGFFPHTIRFKGPTKGTAVTFTFTPSGHTAILNNFQLMQHSRLYPLDVFRSDSNSTFQSNLAATIPNDPVANILASWNPINIGAGVTNIYGIPLWVGKIGLMFSSSSSAADCQVVINSITAQANEQGNVFNGFTNAAGVSYIPEIWLPKAQCQVSIKNGNAAAQNIQLLATMAEY